ncbi:hypothetical protein [Microbulbifer halophilus]|uniref:hypothetical protein n=1 Tax=Microbulbifer halophilus TaxID=453963 RepID=UPI00362108DF
MDYIKTERNLIKSLNEYFKDAAKDYAVNESTDSPFLYLVIEITLYNYFVVRVTVGKSTVFFSIIESGFQLQLFKNQLSISEFKLALKTLDQEIRLRIPDKYLQAKGWQSIK